MPSGRVVTEKEAMMVVNVATEIATRLRRVARRGKSKTYPRGTITQTAQFTHLSREKVAHILRTYKVTGDVPHVSCKRNRRRFAKVDENMQENLRKTINGFLERNEAPTVSKIHRALMTESSVPVDGSGPPSEVASTSTADIQNAQATAAPAWKVCRTTTYYLMKEMGYTYGKKSPRSRRNVSEETKKSESSRISLKTDD